MVKLTGRVGSFLSCLVSSLSSSDSLLRWYVVSNTQRGPPSSSRCVCKFSSAEEPLTFSSRASLFAIVRSSSVHASLEYEHNTGDKALTGIIGFVTVLFSLMKSSILLRLVDLGVGDSPLVLELASLIKRRSQRTR